MEGKQQNMTLEWKTTIKIVHEVLQKCALVVTDPLSFFGHLMLVFQHMVNERGNSFLDALSHGYCLKKHVHNCDAAAISPEN